MIHREERSPAPRRPAEADLQRYSEGPNREDSVKLKAFKVRMYRPILDSGWVDLDDITVIVGKNESGKTALLKALHKFKPFNPEPYTLNREWPRGHRQERSPNEVVVETRFEFEDHEEEIISDLIGQKRTGVEIARLYSGDYEYKLLPDDNIFPSIDQSQLLSVLDGLVSEEGASLEIDETLTEIRDESIELLKSHEFTVFEEKIAEYNQAIGSAVQDGNEQDRIDAARAEKTFDVLLEFAEIMEVRGKIEKSISDWIPTFIYMDDHKPFSGNAHLEQIKQRKEGQQTTDEDKTFLMILEMAGLDFEKELDRASAEDKEQRMLDMNDASSTLTNLLADHWTQRKYRVRFEADGYQIIAFVSDNVQTALVPLDERSTGFQWFFSFDTTFLYETQGTFKNAIILLDEPGLHLHAAAQRDLLMRLKEYAKDNQLIYTTHMPFMIDMERLDNIRVCVEDGRQGTLVSEDLYTADEHARFPLQAALGLSISQSLFVGSYNLVVEGVTDFWLLSTMATILRSEGMATLDENIIITPSGGATKAAYVTTMLVGQKLNVVVLFDSDNEGEMAANELIRKWIIKDKHILYVGKVLKNDEKASIEDMFTDAFYLRFVNDAYTEELKDSPITRDEIALEGQLVERIEKAFVARGMPLNSMGKAFNKGRVAKHMLSGLPKIHLERIPKTVVTNFSRLFQEINAAMPGLPNEPVN